MATVHDRTHLEHLLLESMLRVAPEVAMDCRRQWKKDENPGEPDRSALVHCLLMKTGPKRFLEICEELPLHVPESPLIFFLLNSGSPGDFIKKISTHAPHFHPTRRLDLVEEGENYCIVEDIANNSTDISLAEDMFVHSILKGVLQQLGCKELTVTWEAVSSKELYDILIAIKIEPFSIENVTRWKFSWKEFIPPGSIEGMDEFFLKITGILPTTTKPSLTTRIEKILLENISHRLTTEKMAFRLNISPRTLQRKLYAEGTSYSRIDTELRINTAESLLRQSTLPITKISKLSGFNDSAHLCRAFKKRYGMTPSSYRQASRLATGRHIMRNKINPYQKQ